MELTRMVLLVLCSVFQCEHEYPSDPLQSERAVVMGRSITDRTGRENRWNEVENNGNPIVFTRAGAVEGYVMKTIKGRSIAAFEGIPFAEDTGGRNRFMPPLPKRNWTGIRQAKSVGRKCIQLHLIHAMQLTGSEDCLFLNIYIPQSLNTKKQNLPVLVFFHGGSWFFGAGSEYGPAYLLEHDIILVTVNYRLGIFGFLSTGDEVLPGNLGLKDQSLGLKWVQKNIKGFGGDPREVTIAGQSSGAASVHLHMMSRMSRGTFARAISMSGNAFSSWSISNTKIINHRNAKLARASRCPQRPSDAFVRCLKRLSGPRLARLFLRVYDSPLVPTVPLAAVIEPDLPGAFLTAHPDELYARNEVARVPWICSRNLNESQALFTVFNLFGLSRENVLTRPIWRRFAPYFLDYKFVAKDPDQITEKIQDFYVRKSNFSTDGNIYAELSTDRIFGYGVHKSLQIHSQLAPTYSWLYAYQGRSSLIAQVGEDPKKFGVSHTDDLAIYFNMSEFYPGYKTTDPEYAVVKLTTSLIANFVIQGEPLYTDEDGNKLEIWDPVTDPRNIRVLSINEEVKMIPEPHQQRYKFWEELGLSDLKPFIPIL